MIKCKFIKLWLVIMKRINFNFILLFNIFLLTVFYCKGDVGTGKIISGADQYEIYLPILRNKQVGLVVNQTSTMSKGHLVDFLKSEDIKIKAIFAPEHGFRGNSERGAKIENSKDDKTGIRIISLYGDNKKPTWSSLIGIDILIFDIQDVGCRFFTYISTLHYVMEACAENNILLMILDRPNPNGDYVDGPVLKKEMQSFVGMHPIPIVHGCTIGELAQMINSEGWLENKMKCRLKIIPCKNYTHKDIYCPPVKPSPSLTNLLSIRLYPSLCLFESTKISIGRGTDYPFQVIGYPDKTFGKYSFIPVSKKGVSDNPTQKDKICYGDDLRSSSINEKFSLSYFIGYYNKFTNKDLFWDNKKWIGKLTGDPRFYDQITEGMNETEIRKSWQPDLEKYKAIRVKYLLYPDFE